jgi:oligosaccharide repeat unit polymerase
MNYLWVGIFILFILTLFNYLLFRDLIYPAFIQSALWLSILLIFSCNVSYYYDISSEVIFIIVSGSSIFTIGSYIFNWKHAFSKTVRDLNLNYFPSKIWLRLFFAVSLLGLFLTYKKSLDLAANGPFNNYFINLRLAIHDADAEGGYGKLNYFLWIAYFSMAIHLIEYWGFKYKSIFNLLFTLTSVVIALAIAVLHTGRTHILFVLIIIIFIGFLAKRINYFFALIMSVIFIIGIFSLYAIILNKGGSFESGVLDNSYVLKDIIVHYIVSPLPALTILINSAGYYQFPDNILTSLVPYFNKLGFAMREISTVRDFVDVPLPTNIYTAYDVYYLDLGLIGVILFQFIAGLWHGFLYAKIATNKVNLLSVVLFVFFMFPLIIQYSGDYYVIGIRAWIYITIMSLFLELMGKLSIKKIH